MRHLIVIVLLISSIACFSQTIEVVEQSISVCYMNDSKRTDIVAVTKAETEFDGLKIVAYFDCSSPISEPCNQISLGIYKPNSISINGETIGLGEQLNANNINTFNMGRFFSAEDNLHRFLIFEMADIDCPNVADKYCYIILYINQKTKITKHVLYNKENNSIMEDELSNIIEGVKKNVFEY